MPILLDDRTYEYLNSLLKNPQKQDHTNLPPSVRYSTNNPITLYKTPDTYKTRKDSPIACNPIIWDDSSNTYKVHTGITENINLDFLDGVLVPHSTIVTEKGFYTQGYAPIKFPIGRMGDSYTEGEGEEAVTKRDIEVAYPFVGYQSNNSQLAPYFNYDGDSETNDQCPYNQQNNFYQSVPSSEPIETQRAGRYQFKNSFTTDRTDEWTINLEANLSEDIPFIYGHVIFNPATQLFHLKPFECRPYSFMWSWKAIKERVIT